MATCVRMTIAELEEKIKPFIGQKFRKPRTTNKGEIGILLEQLTGIPQTSACLDCVDGELKVFPVKRNSAGQLVPKETIAVTMLDKDELKSSEFKGSRVCAKLSRALFVPYERTGDEVCYMTPTLIDMGLEENKELYSKLCSDYDVIRAKYIEAGELSSRDGLLLQNRTKGAGHGSTSRAFYLKKEFAKEYLSF